MGKLYAGHVGGRHWTGDDDGSFPKGPIQSRSQLVEEFSKFEREVVVERFFEGEFSDSTSATCPVVLQIERGTWRVFLKQCVGCFYVSVGVQICPSNSIPASLKT